MPIGYPKMVVTTPAKQQGDCYTTRTYCRAIREACKTAGIPHWSPHRLRHTRATYLRKKYGLEAAKVVLGEKTLVATQVYAEQDMEKAIEVMAEIG